MTNNRRVCVLRSDFFLLLGCCKVFPKSGTFRAPLVTVEYKYFVCSPTCGPAIQLQHDRRADFVRGLVTERCAFIFGVLFTPDKNLF